MLNRFSVKGRMYLVIVSIVFLFALMMWFAVANSQKVRDMGLGKTVQTIAALLYFARTEKERKPSVIIAPTSLTYTG